MSEQRSFDAVLTQMERALALTQRAASVDDPKPSREDLLARLTEVYEVSSANRTWVQQQRQSYERAMQAERETTLDRATADVQVARTARSSTRREERSG